MMENRWSDIVDTPADSDEEDQIPATSLAKSGSTTRRILHFINNLLITDYYTKCRWCFFLSHKGLALAELPRFVATSWLVEFLIFNTLVCSAEFQNCPRPLRMPSMCYFNFYEIQCQNNCCLSKYDLAQHITEKIRCDKKIACRWKAFLLFHNLEGIGLPFYACVHMLQAFRLILHPGNTSLANAVCSFCGQKMGLSTEGRPCSGIPKHCILYDCTPVPHCFLFGLAFVPRSHFVEEDL